jgi:hypothetical protein
MSCTNCLLYSLHLPTELATLYGNVDHSQDTCFRWNCSVCGDVIYDHQALVKFTHVEPHTMPGVHCKAILKWKDLEAYLTQVVKKLPAVSFFLVSIFRTSFYSLKPNYFLF